MIDKIKIQLLISKTQSYTYSRVKIPSAKVEKNKQVMMLSICGLYQILAYVYEIINAYSIKFLMVVPFMNLLKSTLSPIPCKCPVSEYCQILHFPLPSIEGCLEL